MARASAGAARDDGLAVAVCLEAGRVLARNEQAMVHMAIAFAKTRARLGTLACTTSVGPGATNLVTGAATATVDRLLEIAGADRLRLVHANDSMDVRGAFKDRHQKIGDGHIGLGAFEELFAHPATAGVPFVLETPGSRDADDPQIGLLQKLRAR